MAGRSILCSCCCALSWPAHAPKLTSHLSCQVYKLYTNTLFFTTISWLNISLIKIGNNDGIFDGNTLNAWTIADFVVLG